MMSFRLEKREHGDWYVGVEGFGRLPVGHNWCMVKQPSQYFDLGDGERTRRWRRWIRDVQASKYMVIQTSLRDRNGTVHCTGYVGLFKVTDAKFYKGAFTANIEQIGEVHK
jgi:hypothetical protein